MSQLIKEAGKLPWMPGVRSTFRLLLIARGIAALHSGISDCDETFNYWEPLHLLSHPPRPLGQSQTPFQTWEYAPQFAIRSWAYVAQYAPLAAAVARLLGREKSAAFYATRIFLAFSSSLCEAALVKSVADVVHPRVARYMLVFLIFSAGLYHSAIALLPSTFAMYTTTLAMSFAMLPSATGADQHPRNRLLSTLATSTRTICATAFFALGALLAWPFALVLALPFVFEEALVPSGVLVVRSRYAEFVSMRIGRWIGAVVISALIAVPIFLVDTLAYARPVFVPLNIIAYNVLSAKRGAGPTLYGTEPWHYYLLNLTLNFGPTLLLALASLPVILIVSFAAPSRIAHSASFSDTKKADDGEATQYIATPALRILVIRMLPLYLWLGLLSAQPHKEERFMFPAYPLLCFNAAVGLYGLLALLSELFRINDDPYSPRHTASLRKRQVRRGLALVVLVATSVVSVSRSWHTTNAYRAPVAVLAHLSEHELPRVVARLYPEQQPKQVKERVLAGLPPVPSAKEIAERSWVQDRKHDVRVDLNLLVRLARERSGGQEDEAIRLCYGKEWYRFPATYLVPDGVAVDFIASDFRGILPKHFVRPNTSDAGLELLWPWRPSTRAIQPGFNDMNREEPDRYVDVSSCDYLVDVDWPHRTSRAVSTSREPRFAAGFGGWQRVYCEPFLDAVASRASQPSRTANVRATIERAFWLPAFLRGNTNRYGDYCLLRTKRKSSLVNR